MKLFFHRFAGAVLLLVAINAHATCGDVPQQPVLLDEPQLNLVQIELLNDQFDLFLAGIDSFQTCIDSNIMSLDTEAEGYQASFDSLAALLDASETQKNDSVDRFNFLIDTVNVNEE